MLRLRNIGRKKEGRKEERKNGKREGRKEEMKKGRKDIRKDGLMKWVWRICQLKCWLRVLA